jgi:photosystem II stability/assembly factor-like uncharacterized protein
MTRQFLTFILSAVCGGWLLVSQTSVPQGWRIIGPGGGGAQYRPTVSPHDPDTALVACDMTGAYITRDGGRRWRQFNLRTRVDAFAFDPVNPKIVYAGSSGLFQSADQGERWRLIFPDPKSGVKEQMAGDHADHRFSSGGNWPGGRIGAIRIDPGQPDHIFLGIHSNPLQVFHSADGGKSWKKALEVPGRSFRRIYIDPASAPANRRVLIVTDRHARLLEVKGYRSEPVPLPPGAETIADAVCGVEPPAGSTVCYATAPGRREAGRLVTGVWKSTGLGGPWQALRSGLDHELAPGAVPNFTRLGLAENNARTVYLAVTHHPQPQAAPRAVANHFGIMKTADGGETWAWVLRAAGPENPANKTLGWIGRNYGPGWGEAPLGLGVAPSNPEVCYATDLGTTYRTANGGRTWEPLYSRDEPDGSSATTGLDVTTSYGVHFDPFDKNHVVISYTDIGLFRSRNGGRTWLHAVQGVPRQWINTCYWVAFDPKVKGRAWSVWGDGHDLPRPKMFRGDFERFLGGVCRTDNGLETWQQSSEGIPPNTPSTHIVIDPRSPPGSRTLYVAGFGKGVFKSTDDGRTWILRNNGIGTNRNAWRLVLVPDGTLYLLVARGLVNGKEVDGAVYKSTDGAAQWQPVRLPAGVNAPNDLVFDASNPKRMYLACWPKTVDGAERFGGVYGTSDGGKTWRGIFNPAAHAYGLAIDPDSPRTLFLNTFNSSAFRSDDAGKTWHRLEGYNFKWGHRPVPDPHNKGMLYLTTFGSSVWYGPALGVPGAFEDIYSYR